MNIVQAICGSAYESLDSIIDYSFEDFSNKGEPVMFEQVPVMFYNVGQMVKVNNGWHYIKKGNSAVVAKFDGSNIMKLFFINLSRFNFNELLNVSNRELYGVNRKHSLSNIVGTLHSEVIGKSYDYKTLKRRAIEIGKKSRYIKSKQIDFNHFLFTAHVYYKHTNCTCLAVIRINDAYFDYVCIPDRIMSEVIKFLFNE